MLFFNVELRIFRRVETIFVFVFFFFPVVSFYSVESDSIESVFVSAYLRRGHYNVILVDWTKLAVLPWYVTAVRNAKIVGPYLARTMSWLDAQKAAPLSKIHVIGFSLGAEVAGFMGKALASRKVRSRNVR